MISLQNCKLIELLPPNMKDESMQALSYAIDKEIEKLVQQIQKVQILCDIENVDEMTLDCMAFDLNVKCYEDSLPFETKLALFKENTYGSKFTMGTAKTISNIMAVLYGGAKVVEWFENNQEPYTFQLHIKAPQVSSQEDFLQHHNGMVAKANEVKNARSQLSKVMMFMESDTSLFVGAYSTVGHHLTILPYMPQPLIATANSDITAFVKTGQRLFIIGKE